MAGYSEIGRRISETAERSEQDIWREARLFATMAFTTGLRSTEAIVQYEEADKITAIRGFFRTVIESPLTDVEGERSQFTSDVIRPDGIVRRVLIKTEGHRGVRFGVKFSNVLEDGTVVKRVETDDASFLDIATGIVY